MTSSIENTRFRLAAFMIYSKSHLSSQTQPLKNESSRISTYNRGMTHILHGNHIGKQGILRLGCSAVLLDENHARVLLTRRSDNGMWCLPGGMIEAGESVAEGCIREVYEETGLRVRILRLSGVYSDPDNLVVYPDGTKVHIVVLNFVVEILSGQLGISSETTAIDWFPVSQALTMDLFHGHVVHIRDALMQQVAAFIR
jgi:8-oxo-dGTP pyrophosphatase MutT (NUDIX family)